MTATTPDTLEVGTLEVLPGARRFVGWTGGRDSNDHNGARLYECETTGRVTCRTIRPLPAGRAYQERCARWVQHGPWQVRGLRIEAAWQLAPRNNDRPTTKEQSR